MGAYVLISVLIILTCILLVLIVLVQNAKGGGLAANFSSNNQVMGVRKTTDFLEKSTWTLAIVLVLLTLTSTFIIPRSSVEPVQQSEVRDLIPNQQAPMPMPQMPAETPQPGEVN
ncbi:MAG TPA: preprotein translocase subunit SecG [Bacteroidales bacterium]|nr:preprotein translocase subunit SecG [Bacteroidales bacterium]